MDFLDLFKRNNAVNKTMDELNRLEKNLGYSIPPFLGVFHKLFDVSSYPSKTPLFYFDDFSNDNIQFYDATYEPNIDYLVDDLFGIDSIYEKMIAVYPLESYVWSEKLIAVAECFDQQYLFVGASEHNLDKVYISYQYEESPNFVADNIFEYFMGYKIVPLETSLPEGVTLNNLYKNWNEDFWRIRPE